MRGWLPTVALVLAVTAGFVGFRGGERAATAAAQRPPHPLEWDGHRWSDDLASDEKLAFLAGFIAGAGAAQAYPGAEAAEFDGEAMERRVQELREQGELNFKYGTTLYYSRLHDYYFYVDRRDRPLYRAIAELTFRLQRDHN
jgi:hypothetical protein